MNNLRAVQCFIRAVDEGSLAGAARSLSVSAAAVSQQIANLEEWLGVRLLERTTRQLHLTDQGRTYYEQVKPALMQLREANRNVQSLSSEPRGRLSIAATAAFSRHVLAPLLPEFSARYPLLDIEMRSTDRLVRHAEEAVDVSIRFQSQLEEGLVARLLAKVPFIFCASPQYLAEHGTPTEPEHLKQHACLAFRFAGDGRLMRWPFIRHGQRFDAPIQARIISDDIDALAHMALSGGGITRLADFVAAPYLASGQLVPLFVGGSEGDAVSETMDIYFCVNSRHALTAKVVALQEHLQRHLPTRWLP